MSFPACEKYIYSKLVNVKLYMINSRAITLTFFAQGTGVLKRC